MERSFAVALKCYGGFVLVSDQPPSGHPFSENRIWSINSESAAISHGSLQHARGAATAVFPALNGQDPVEVVFERARPELDAYCAQNAMNQSLGFIFAGYNAERQQRIFGWMWNGQESNYQSFDGPIIHGFVNPLAIYIGTKLYSFDLNEELATRLALYMLVQTRTHLAYPMDEFAQVGWLRSSVGLEVKNDDYVRGRLDLIHTKSEELRFRCQQLLAKEQS
jgi:hypothetical protein